MLTASQNKTKPASWPAEEEGDGPVTDDVEAGQVLLNDNLFRALVVQRSRAYVRRSQLQQHGAKAAIFPDRKLPEVAAYSLKQTSGPTLQYIEEAFSKGASSVLPEPVSPLAISEATQRSSRSWQAARAWH